MNDWLGMASQSSLEARSVAMPGPHTSKKAPGASLLAAKENSTTLRQLQDVSCAVRNLGQHDLAVAQIGSATSASGRSVVWFDWA